MLICGIKASHDAAVALIDGDRLVFSVELEKLDNKPRNVEMRDVTLIPEVLASRGYRMEDVDRFVLDGWRGSNALWQGAPTIQTRDAGRALTLDVAAYHEHGLEQDILERTSFEGRLPIGGRAYDYVSYLHVAGHVLAAYCTSPFARANEAAYVLVWDGGQYPRLYHVDPARRRVRNRGHLFSFLGTLYSIMGFYFGPYKKTEAQLEEAMRTQDLDEYFGGCSIAGKLMSYIALGVVRPELLAEMPRIYERELELLNTFENRYMRALRAHVEGKGYADADVLTTLHAYLEGLLLDGLARKVREDALPPQALCFCGGSALNIKWNSAIRASGLFRGVWVPPFPNDAGSAIGAACCERMTQGGRVALDWTVYSGPAIVVNDPAPGWRARPCSVHDLARLLATDGEPVVFLHGAAELGPRALGHRSILAPATDPTMKDTLNRIKAREPFRPVAPVCMEEHARAIFEPGSPDPFMLFDHLVRDDWKRRVPAICHLDGTARLQTVSAHENPTIYKLLEEYHRRTGIPLLCNTSANFNGSGFFPDVYSATRWGGTSYVWCNDTLYVKEAPGAPDQRTPGSLP